MAQGKELPIAFEESVRYFNEVILPDENVFSLIEGKHVAVVRQNMVDSDSDPRQLAERMGIFRDLIFYMPHAVKFEPVVIGEEDPDHYLEAQNYYAYLRKNQDWMRAHLGRYVAIIGRQVVDEASGDEFSSLHRRVIDKYGAGTRFMTKVESRSRRVEHISL